MPFRDRHEFVSDKIKIEQMARKFSLLKGGKIEDWERDWLTHSLNNGESIMNIWGLALTSCQFEEPSD